MLSGKSKKLSIPPSLGLGPEEFATFTSDTVLRIDKHILSSSTLRTLFYEDIKRSHCALKNSKLAAESTRPLHTLKPITDTDFYIV